MRTREIVVLKLDTGHGQGAGWFAALVVQPVQQINELRRQTFEAMLTFGRLQADAPERQSAAETFTRIGVGLISHHVASAPWTPLALRWISWRSLDIHSAGEQLLGFGHNIRFNHMTNPELSPSWSLIQNALSLPPLTPSAMTQALMKHISQPDPAGSRSEF